MLLSELSYSSFMIWSAWSKSDMGEQSRSFFAGSVKRDRPLKGSQTGGEVVDTSVYLAMRIAARSPELVEWLDGATLVPMPGHAKRLEGALWVPQRIAAALAAAGIGSNHVDLIERAETVERSRSGATRSVSRHFESMRITKDVGLFEAGPRIVIVDDAVSSGASALGAASRIADAFPDCDVSLFAIARTMSTTNFEKRVGDDLFAPVLDGRIYRNNDRGRRDDPDL